MYVHICAWCVKVCNPFGRTRDFWIHVSYKSKVRHSQTRNNNNNNRGTRNRHANKLKSRKRPGNYFVWLAIAKMVVCLDVWFDGCACEVISMQVTKLFIFLYSSNVVVAIVPHFHRNGERARVVIRLLHITNAFTN